MYALLLLPLAILLFLRISLVKSLALSFIRMSIQLLLVGLYLGFLFEKNSISLNLLWLGCMVLVANFSILKATNLPYGKFVLSTLPILLISFALILAYMLFVVVLPDPWYDARYLIPLGGMILGNSLRSLTISLERFITLLKQNRGELYGSFCMGATRLEALRPYYREALQAAISPALIGIATIGLVSLPGMMTGQMLGGSFPILAIKYQIVIMIAIFTSQVVIATLNLFMISNRFFDEFDRLVLKP